MKRKALRTHLIEPPASALPYRPVWAGPFETYTRRYIAKNLWRLSRTCDADDAMQEARIVFLDCTRRYTGRVDNPAWFMALYKMALFGRFDDLATQDTRYRSVGVLMCEVVTEEDASPIEAIGTCENEGVLHTIIRQAPDEVRSVLSLLLNAPAEILELAAEAWGAQGKKSAFGNAMLCRMLGLPERADPLGAVRDYLG